MTDSRPLIVHIVFRFDFGGLENGVVNVVNGTRTAGFRHAIIALTETTEFKKRLDPAVPVYALDKQPGKDPAAYWRLFRLLRKLRPAVVHTRNVGTLDCAFIAFLARVPVRIHGEHGWDIFDPDGTRSKYRLIRRILGRFVRVFVTVSDDLRRWLTNAVGIAPAKIERITNGVDVEKFRPARADDARLLPPDVFPPDALVLGSVTRFSAIKDPLNLVAAFIAVRAAHGAAAQRLRLLMVGDGELRQAALERLAAAGLADAAWLPGSRNDIPELLRSMHIFALGSLREGISNTVLEAMASGLPVIASDTGGNTELVLPGATGALVPPADTAALAAAIGAYVTDDALRVQHGRAGRERAVAEFSIAAMLRRYRELYEHTLAIAET